MPRAGNRSGAVERLAREWAAAHLREPYVLFLLNRPPRSARLDTRRRRGRRRLMMTRRYAHLIAGAILVMVVSAPIFALQKDIDLLRARAQ